MVILESMVGLGVAGVLVLFVIAFVRIQQIGQRMEQLEDEVGRLRRAARAAPPPATPIPEEVVQVESVPSTPQPEEEPLDAIPVDAAPEPRPRRGDGVPPTDADALESWIGQKAMGWTAVVLLLFATAFFLKYAFDNNWIGELGRVSLGVLAGAALCVGGLAAHRRGRPLTSQMLSAAGVALLYLTTFAAFGYYHLLPRDRAAVFLIVVVIEAAALAVLYDAPAIAVMAVVGGLLSPVLLHSDHDEYVSLFFYLAVLNAGVAGVALFRGRTRRGDLQGLAWRFLPPIALLGTQTLYWIWYEEHYHPAKVAAALLFQGVVFALYLGHDLVAPVVRRRHAHPLQAAQLLLNAFFFSRAGYVLLREDYHPWLPAGALGLAIVYAGLGFFLQRRLPDDAWLQLSAAAAGFSFVAIAIALRGEAAWISLGWAVEGAALWWFGLRIRAEPLRWFGAGLLLLAVGRLVLVDMPWAGRDFFVPIFNRHALPALAVAACLLAAAWATRRFPRIEDVDRTAWWLIGLGGVMLVWLILSLETYQFLKLPLDDLWFGIVDRQRLAQAGLSVLWAVYAGVVLAVGFWQHSRPLRVTALGLFGLTLGKVVLVDMAGLQEFYRVLAFFVLAVVMGAAAWTYQRIEAGRRLGS